MGHDLDRRKGDESAVRIAGLQKMTLLDYPGRVACTVFTAGCDLRCPFCHNAPLVLPGEETPQLSEEEILAFLSTRRGLLDGVAITGGEPLLHPDIGAFLEKIRALGFAVKLDTNGTFPARLEELIRAGLVDRVAMDVKNGPSLYAKTVGLPKVDMEAIGASKELLLRGSVDYEFRTTVVRGLHTEESLLEAARWIAGAKEYYLQQYKDSGHVIAAEGLGSYSEKEMYALAAAVAEIVPAVQVRGV